MEVFPFGAQAREKEGKRETRPRSSSIRTVPSAEESHLLGPPRGGLAGLGSFRPVTAGSGFAPDPEDAENNSAASAPGASLKWETAG